MSVGEPPVWASGLDNAAAASDAVKQAIDRAIARLHDVGENLPGISPDTPDVFDTVGRAYRMGKDLTTDSRRQVVLGYFLESVATLAIARSVSGQTPLSEWQLGGLFRRIKRIFAPLFAPP